MTTYSVACRQLDLTADEKIVAQNMSFFDACLERARLAREHASNFYFVLSEAKEANSRKTECQE